MIRPGLLAALAAAVGILMITKRAAPDVDKETGTGGAMPKTGRTWDLANWSEVAASKGIEGPPPPGLPITARRPSERGAALPAIRTAAASYGVPGFVEAMEALALNESGARYALPAWTYDTRPKSQRPPGKSFISAWGVFQWQNAHAKKNFNKANSYQISPQEETAGSVARYAQLLGPMDNDPAGIFLWHITPAGYSTARKAIQAGTPARQAILQAAAGRNKTGTLSGYLAKWAARWPQALA